MVYRNRLFPASSVSHRETVAAVLAAAVAVAVAACSGGAPSVRADDLIRADRASVSDGGSVRWAVDAVPSTLNVFQSDASATSQLVASAVLPTLFTVDAQGKANTDPDYLVSADQTATSPQTVVYRLNPKAVWSDGKHLGLADFVGQWQALSGRDPAFAAAGTARTDGYDSIASVTSGGAPDSVKVVFAKPYAPWRSLFTPLYPAAATATPQSFSQSQRTALTADAGPFTFKNENAQALTVVRNPHWWGDRAKLDAVAFTVVAPDTAASALAAHRVDIADLSQAADDTGYSPEATSGTQILRAAGPDDLQLAFNGANGLLADPDVRRAVADAIDRQAIADAILRPLRLPAVPLGNHLLLADQPGYQDDAAALGAGADAATKLLDAAGWKLAPHGDAANAAASPVRAKDTRTLSLTLLTRAGSARDATIARLLASQLSQIGITLTTKPVPASSFFTQHVASGDFDLALVTWPASRFPIADESALYEKPQVNPDGSLNVGQNLSGTGTDEINSLLSEAVTSTDTADATRLANEADIRIWQAAPSVPLFQTPELVGTRLNLVNVGAFGLASPRWQDMGYHGQPH
ncbi:ABC transporter family substrate-binding protein [Streptacidiphilus fuscans]|uniref:ABC transporter family substrate-binding protein n=1 Tax=Streptacidiphilus fuscans TaxID=2789292 RepID=A0A931AY52_9ACTN|nr:ABC transporter family substrate-binding protein [Streptacidiphilus fuscans]MBF9067675.1 ABC transporter family substrate-binding protein [Streptacidiphilus fuscans]